MNLIIFKGEENMKKRASVFGIFIGIIAIIAGISMLNTSIGGIGEYITFGADFYTEIYSVTRELGWSVSSATQAICNGIGWLLIVSGGFSICHFLTKLGEPTMDEILTNLRYSQVNSNSDSPSIGADITPKYCPQCGNRVYAYPCNGCGYSPTPEKAAPVSTSSWICSNCGAENSTNHSQCKKCGLLMGAVKVKDLPSAATGNPAPVVDTAPGAIPEKWVCRSCGTENSMKHGQCKKCGQFK